jgi:hypothetical protein
VNDSKAGSTPLGQRRGPAFAQALRAELGEKSSDVQKIAAELGLAIREEAAEGFDGALIRDTNYPIGAIIVRASIPEPGRKTFTIAHEIGHFVLPGHDGASLACTSSEVNAWGQSSSGQSPEREADEFAAELLMPAELVRDVISTSSPSLQLIEEIARRSNASFSAAAWRYCDLSPERCAIVWSTDGVQRWSVRSIGFPFFLPNGRPVHTGSFAAACFDEEKVPQKPREVSSSLWIDALEPPKRIWEQSKALPAYRSVISLLWIKDAESKT